MQKRVPNFGEDIRSVAQDEHEVDISCDILETTGLGPCIGIAVPYMGRLSLAHAPNAAMSALNDFFEALANAIPESARPSIHPVVVGGKIDEDLETVADDRIFVLQELQQLGFGSPHVRWCTAHEDCHELELDAVDGAVWVTSQPSRRLERFAF